MRLAHRRWADHSSLGFAGLDHARLVAVLPLGAIEQHGPHLPLSVDTAIVEALVDAVIAQLPEDSPALVLPTCAIGKSDEHAAFPGTLTLSAETLMQVWREIGASVARAGVRKILLLNAHGGQIAPAEIVARDLRSRHGMMAFVFNWWQPGLPEGLYGPAELRHGIHAGDMETSVMLAVAPDLVAMDRARDFRSLALRMEEETPMLGLAPGLARMGWLAHDLNPEGACGDASAATAAKGRATLDHAARLIVAALGEIDRAPMDWTRGEPAW